ncbi:protein-tyrosine phosphatase-like protein [Apodospora peruviana]|uniref:Protein-tyrosine phosphatase-like protein n=1 Tax=Apodospora peruviana TaxID=516989 RepID=A0AAE0I6B6_9PEZI|nr:protein-tyrosine phosphatase-like protein [Apodospora peruviana]
MNFTNGGEGGSTLPHGAIPTSLYSSRPPSPPYIHVPSIAVEGKVSLSIVPSFNGIDSSQLTQEDLEIITQNGKRQIALDTTGEWRYESRRKAQPILDFLYLGPIAITRDPEFLRDNGITMVLTVLEERIVVTFGNLRKRIEGLGVVVDGIVVNSVYQLNGIFGVAVKKINEHLLEVYRSQAVGQNGDGGIAIDNGREFKRGKVLVCCETGNGSSAAICAAYLMNVFGLDYIKAMQFVGLQRFCTNFDDDSKRILQAHDELLKARRDVSAAQKPVPNSSIFMGTRQQHSKRHIEDTMDITEDGMDGANLGGEMDEERYVSRGFAPFVQGGPSSGL